VSTSTALGSWRWRFRYDLERPLATHCCVLDVALARLASRGHLLPLCSQAEGSHRRFRHDLALLLGLRRLRSLLGANDRPIARVVRARAPHLAKGRARGWAGSTEFARSERAISRRLLVLVDHLLLDAFLGA